MHVWYIVTQKQTSTLELLIRPQFLSLKSQEIMNMQTFFFFLFFTIMNVKYWIATVPFLSN